MILASRIQCNIKYSRCMVYQNALQPEIGSFKSKKGRILDWAKILSHWTIICYLIQLFSFVVCNAFW